MINKEHFKCKRAIRYIIIHCSATPEGKDYTVDDIDNWHRRRGFCHGIGYNAVIYRDGTVHLGRPLSMPGAHTLGHNSDSVGICYIGGLDRTGMHAKDTRTAEQKDALIALVADLKRLFPKAEVCGHREFARKACPCFNVKADNELVSGKAIR